jgi:hypothetical protein
MAIIPNLSKIGHYIFEQQIGQGTFAHVWLATHELTHIKAAVKIISKSVVSDSEAVTRLTRELNFMKQIRHPFIAQFYESLEDEDAHYYVMEYAEHGSILNYITSHGPLSEQQARHYFSQIVSVLDYLHTELHVCHRDVKAENILLDKYNNIRVIDFGLSNQFTTAQPLLNSACGSAPYASPEMAKGQPYSTAADIWSAGILLYSMVTGLLPFDDENVQTLLRKIVTQEAVYPSFLSPSLIDLLKMMLIKSPERRITLAEVKEHDWFSQQQYMAFFAMQLGERSMETIADPEILERMLEMGIPTATLREQLLVEACTELTAMYAMFRRQRLTEHIRTVVAGLSGGAGGGGKSGSGRIPVRAPEPSPRKMRAPIGPRSTAPQWLGPPRQIGAKGTPMGNAAALATQRFSPVQSPAPEPFVVRRFSRPLAVTRMVTTGRDALAGRARSDDTARMVIA